jgi:short subunit dehydrogenase-like uncharacterized protein
MAPRIVLFGATGYTGELTARALVAKGAEPVLAARSPERLAALASELGGLETHVADVGRPQSVAALVARGDVLVSTVGPFSRWGAAAVEAAIAVGAHYIDSTGEGSFIRRIFEEWGPRAASADSALLTAFGYDWVPGNLAGALALRDGGEAAARVEIAYFTPGGGSAGDLSGGTRASVASVMMDPVLTWRGGRIVDERAAARIKQFTLEPGRRRAAFSVGGTEAFALPRLKADLAEVDVYLGAGAASYGISGLSALTGAVARLPGARRTLDGLIGRSVRGSTGGPDAETRARSSSLVLASAYDASGNRLSDVRLLGNNVYTFTAEILAWGAMTVARGGMQGVGALGPVDGFGLDALEQGAAAAGIAAAG